MDAHRIRLLLVEDNAGDARLIRELLRQADPMTLELTHCERLSDALDHLAHKQPDAILLDLSLPDAQGIETVRRARERAPETPLIVLTGLDDEQMALQAVHAGAQDYLVKGETTGRFLAHAIHYAVERSRSERERCDHLRREQQARAVAETAVWSRDEILATVAHDLRNPLAAITTTAGLLRQGMVSPEESPHHLDVVLRSADQMDRLIRDLLDTVRIAEGTLRIEPRPMSARTIVDETVESLEPQAARAGIRLRSVVEKDLPRVSVDPQRVLQVMANLIANAIRFSHRGSEITLRARKFGEGVLFSVADAGVGIAPEDLPHLFDRKWQAEHARRGGTGRGLAIAKGIVAAHHGRIWAVSEVGNGSTFFFTLPAAVEAAPAEEEREGQIDDRVEEDRAPQTTAVLRVLLVDDHAAIRHGLTTLLHHGGSAEVVGEASTGEEAIVLAERLRPDLVIMDLAMPGMGGLQATRQIAASMPEVRVLALSAEAEEEVLIPVLRAGGMGFVRKTTAHQDLLEALTVVARDEVFLYPTGNRLLLEDYLVEQEGGPLAELSDQERNILLLVAEGYNSTEIGKKMFLSPKTIDSYRSRLMRQLGLNRRADLVHLALQSGLLKPEPQVAAM